MQRKNPIVVGLQFFVTILVLVLFAFFLIKSPAFRCFTGSLFAVGLAFTLLIFPGAFTGVARLTMRKPLAPEYEEKE